MELLVLSPRTPYDEIACAIARIFHDTSHRRAQFAARVHADDRTPRVSIIAPTSNMRHNLGRCTAGKDLPIYGLAVGIFWDLEQHWHLVP
jgi:hypothetical protein